MINEFANPKFHQEVIRHATTKEIVGTLRIKPSGVLWKPKGQHQFYCVSIEQLEEWIKSPRTGARRTNS